MSQEKKEEKRIYRMGWYQKNKEKLKEKAKAYYLANPEKLEAKYEKRKAWERDNQEKIKAWQIAYQKRNKEKIVASSQANYNKMAAAWKLCRELGLME